jgi:formamidopyrimidine-DNA glycosylase
VPELPDLCSIVERLSPLVVGRRIEAVSVKEPIVIRMLLPGVGGFTSALPGRTILALVRWGPFLTFTLTGDAELIVHCMLAGRLQLAQPSAEAAKGAQVANGAKPGNAAHGPLKAKPLGHLCFALDLDDGSRLSYGDDKRMGKVYLTAAGRYEAIPGYREQGVDITSPEFSWERFEQLIQGRRHQARVFLMDQSALSAIGNAYADEILFAAGIHPKTSCSALDESKRQRLFEAIRSVMAWAIEEVRKADQPIEVKVRDHVRVRNRKDQPCPVCGTRIRRVGVLGYDSFFCPKCQPANRKDPA